MRTSKRRSRFRRQLWIRYLRVIGRDPEDATPNYLLGRKNSVEDKLELVQYAETVRGPKLAQARSWA